MEGPEAPLGARNFLVSTNDDMSHNTSTKFPYALFVLAILGGAVFCGVHLLNGWLLSNFEVTSHISFIYMPSFLRLANVLVLGMFWGTAATAIGGVMLMWWSTDSWLLDLCHTVISAGVAGLSIFAMQILLQRRLSISKLSDLLKLALFYALLNALAHHLVWSFLDPSKLVDPNQVLYMVIGDINGAVLGALALRWIAQHTPLINFARRKAMVDDELTDSAN